MFNRNALSEVTACLRERLHRWQQIELLCGLPIMRNPGLSNLTTQLYSDSLALGLPRMPQSSCPCHSSIQGSVEDLLDEPASTILPQMQGKSHFYLNLVVPQVFFFTIHSEPDSVVKSFLHQLMLVSIFQFQFHHLSALHDFRDPPHVGLGVLVSFLSHQLP